MVLAREGLTPDARASGVASGSALESGTRPSIRVRADTSHAPFAFGGRPSLLPPNPPSAPDTGRPGPGWVPWRGTSAGALGPGASTGVRQVRRVAGPGCNQALTPFAGSLPDRRRSCYVFAASWGTCSRSPTTFEQDSSKQEGFLTMSAVCDICGKQPSFGMSVSF